MKNKLIVLLLAAVFASAVNSVEAQWRYGFNFGGSVAGASLDKADGYSLKNRSGFRGGMTVEYQLPKCGLAFDGSMLYERYSTRLVENASAEVADFGRNFIEIPLNVKYKFWLNAFNQLVAPMVFTGPTFRFALNSKDAPLTQQHFQPGWNVGAGLDAANILQLSAGYRFGLGNACKSFDGRENATLHSDGWFIQAVILFDF